MTFKAGERIRETTATLGTGAYALSGAVTGHQAFSVLGNGNQCAYMATDNIAWEVGMGTVGTAPAQVSRDAILASSNAGAAVNWGAGTKDIMCVHSATLTPAMCSFSATKGSTAQTGVASTVDTKVTFTTEVHDTGGYYDAANSIWTPPAGLYLLHAAIYWSAGLVDQNAYTVTIRRGGSGYAGAVGVASGTAPLTTQVTTLAFVNGSQGCEVYALGNGTGNKTIDGSVILTYFWGMRL